MTLEALLVSSTGTLPTHRSPGGASGVWQLWTHLGVVCTHTGAGSVRGSAGHPSAHGGCPLHTAAAHDPLRCPAQHAPAATMDEQRALLDQLMGQHRNMSLEEQKKYT